MVSYLKYSDGFSALDEWTPECWVNVETPTADELVELKNIFDLPEDFLNDLSDIDERPRVERNDGWNCIVLRIPVAGDDIPFATIPLGVMVKDEYVVTVCFYPNNLISDFIDHTQKRHTSIESPSDFILRLLKSSAYWYIRYLKDAKNIVAEAEVYLKRSIRNEDLLKLMNLQKTFVIFATSISGNNILLERINRLYGQDFDKELFEDVSIELRQADSTAWAMG